MIADRIVLGFDTGPTKCGWALARTGSAGRAVFIAGGMVSSERAALRDLLTRTMAAHVGLAAAVECPSGYIHHHARGAALLETARVAGELAEMARALGLEVAQASAIEWRKAFCGKGTADDKRVRRACELFVAGLPKRATNAHVRDALGLACAVMWNPRLGRAR